jgi:hypothetical protein
MAVMAAARVLGGHLVHLVVLVGWVLAVVVVVAWPTAPAGAAEAHGTGARGPASGDGTLRHEGAWLQGAALGAFAAAATHMSVMPSHFRESWLYGGFFLAAAAAQIGLGAMLLGRPSRRILLAGVAGSAAVIVLWAATRLVGIPLGPGAGRTEPVGVLDLIASVAELATVVCGVVVLRGRQLGASWRWSAWSGPMRSALFTTAAVMAVAVVAAPKG